MKKKARILVVDDDLAIREIYCEMLRTQGWEVWEAATGEQGLSLARERHPELILLDVMLPGLGGIEVCKEIKTDAALSDIFVVLFSGNATEATDKAEGLDTGADDYLTKSVSRQEFLARIRTSLRLRDTTAALRASEESFRQLAENIREVFWMSDPAKNQMIYISPGYEEIWGRTCESLYASPRNWVEAIHPEDRERVLDAALTKQVSGEYDQVYRIVRPDGSMRWIQDRAFPIQDRSGEVYRIAGIAEDITKRQQAEDALRESEARKGAIMQAALDGIITIDKEGRIVEFNSAAEKIFGVSCADAIGKEMAAVIIPPSLRQRHREGLAHYLAGGEGPVLGKRIEMTALRADGSEFPVELAITRIALNGPPTFTAFVRDISEQKSAERRLKARNSVIRALAESATLGEAPQKILQSVCEGLGWEMGVLWQVEPQARVLRCVDVWCSPTVQIREFEKVTRSRTFKRGEGLPGRVWTNGRAAWIPDVLADSNFPRSPIAARCSLHAAFGFPILVGNEVVGVIEFFSRQIREPDKALLEMMSALGGQIGQFIVRKQAEEALREAERRYRSIFENAMEGIFQTTPEGGYLSANPALARMLGYESPEELLASVKNVGQQICVRPETRVELKRRLETDGYVRGFENEIYCKDGSKKWASINARLVRDANGAVLYYEGTSQDITERKQIKLALEHKLEELQAIKEDLALQNRELVASRTKLEFERRRYEELFSYAPDGYIVTDLRGLILDLNLAAGRMLQQPRDFRLGVPLIRFFEAADRRKILELLQRAKEGSVERTEEIEAGIRPGTNSKPITCSLRVNALTDATGAIVGFRWLARDITEWKRAQARITTLGHAVESTAEMICITDIEDRFTFVNRSFEQTYGYMEAEILGKTPEILLSPKNSPTLMKQILEQTRLGGWRGEVLDRRNDGSEFSIFLSTSAIKDQNGCVLGFMGVAQDITERKQAEKRTAAFSRLGYWLSSAATPEEAANLIFEIASDLFGWDAGYVHLYSQSEDKIIPVLTLDTIGGQREPIPQTSFTLDPSPLMRAVMEEGPRLINRRTESPGGVPLVPFGETQRRSASKMYVPIHSRGEALGILSIQSYTPEAYSQDDLILLQTLADHCGDALRRIEVAEALREAEARYRSIFENATEGIFQTTQDGRYLNANPALARMFGYQSPAELVSSVSDIERQTFVSAETGGELKRLLQTQDSVVGFEAERYRKDGSKFWTSINVRTVREASGAFRYYEGTVQNITKRKRMDKQSMAFSQLGHRLSGAGAPEQAANIILEIASELFGWDAGYVHLYSAAEDKIVRVLTVDTLNGQRMPASPGRLTSSPSPLMRLVMKDGPRLVNRGSGGSEPVELFPFGDTRRRAASMMYVPIHSGEAVIGILSVQSYTPKAYSDDDLRLLQTLADRCGDALARIKVAEALGEAEAKYHSIFENATEGIFQTTPDGRYLSANLALARMFGYDLPEDLISSITNIEDQTYVIPGRREELKRLLEAESSVKGFEAERYRKDGSRFWISINGHVVRDAEGGVLYYEGTNQDITKRKNAETVLRESEERFRTLFESAAIGVALHDAKGRYVHINHAYQQMVGYTEEELRQLGVKRITHPDDISEGQHLFDELGDGKRDDYQREKRYLHKDGHLVWAQSSASVIRNGHGDLQYIISMVENITERRQGQEALRESERKLRLIADNTTDVIFSFDMERRPVYINPAVKELTGYTFAEIQERGFINWVHPDDQKRMLRLWDELYEGKAYSDVEFRLRTKSGEIKWSSSTWGPLFDEGGNQIGVQGRERDITERKNAEEELRGMSRRIIEAQEAERQRVARELHDGVNQIIASAKMRLRKVEDAVPPLNPASREILARCDQLLVRALEENRRIAHNLRPSDLDEFGLTAACRNFCKEIQTRTSLNIKSRITRIDHRWPREVELNLFRIVQETINNVEKHAGAKLVRLQLALHGDSIVLRIRDDGKGFNPETSKARKGHGIGLTNIRERTASLGGTCEIKTAPGKGTSITVRVPYAAPK